MKNSFHDKTFWQRSNDAAREYNEKVTPTGLRNILTIHGTADRIVPYHGGMRGRNARHLSAQETAFIWARQQGHEGKQLANDAGRTLRPDVVRYDYPKAHVSHIKLVGTGHGLDPHALFLKRLVAEFIRDSKPIPASK